MRIYKKLIGVESLPRQKLKTSNVVPPFIVCSNRNRSGLVRDLLSYNSLFANSVFFDAPSMNNKCAAHEKRFVAPCQQYSTESVK